MKLTDTTGRRGAAPLAATIALALLSGCYYTPPTAPDPPLTAKQAGEVYKCQAALSRSGTGFSAKYTKFIQTCAGPILKSRLEFENGVIDEPTHEADIEKARAKCDRFYGVLSKLSTKYMDALTKACEPVADSILGDYDALRWQAMASVIGITSSSTFDDFLYSACTLSVLSSAWDLNSTFPRYIEALSYLGPEYITIYTPAVVDDDGQALAAIQMDERCPDFIGMTTTTTTTP
jgi:hypothetical protein